MSGRSVWPTWLVTRLLVLGLLLGFESRVAHDVLYFARSLRHIHVVGLSSTMPEYPLPAVGVVAVPWLFAKLLGSALLFRPVMVACGVGVDALYTAVLLRSTGPGRRPAVLLWLAAVPALGGLTYVRFDLIAGVLVGFAMLVAATHPRRAALCVAIATSIKLWPALLIPTVWLRVASRWRYLVVVGFVGLLAVGSTVALAGWSRLVSPMVYQSHRGLQVESVAATPVMVARVVRPAGWRVFYSQFKAYEISGRGVAWLERVTDIATLVLVVGLCLLWIRAWRRSRGVDPDFLVWLCLGAVSGFMAVGKVLSPQYFLWLLPATAAALTIWRSDPRALRRWSVVVVVAAALTHVLFPWLYHDLLHGGDLLGLAVTLLAVRNLLVLWLFVEAARQAVRCLEAFEDELAALSRTS